LGDPQFVDLKTRTAVTWGDFYETFRSIQPHVLHLIATGVVSQSASPLRGQALAFLTDANTPMRQGEPYSLHGADELAELAVSNRTCAFSCSTAARRTGSRRAWPAS
jgi:hypothetical protein